MGLLFATSVEFRKEIGSSSRKGKGEDVSKPREGSQEKEVDWDAGRRRWCDR